MQMAFPSRAYVELDLSTYNIENNRSREREHSSYCRCEYHHELYNNKVFRNEN